MLVDYICRLGRRGIHSLTTTGRAGIMLYQALVGRPEPKTLRFADPATVCRGVESVLIIWFPACLSAWYWGCKVIVYWLTSVLKPL